MIAITIVRVSQADRKMFGNTREHEGGAMRAMSDRSSPSVENATRRAALACIGKLRAFGTLGGDKR
ncbi:hypothetical protein UC34_20715 [Pandoraea vervacti]|uniref:Uncharacterized protein n=1 Tax=Pandoraea vervacti TaxID=656178 RepID=A0ABM5T1N8_9BURK|nr:hypothetical protein UC34_20715 [Pandoraea vervacti]